MPPDPDAFDTARVIAVLERIAKEHQQRHQRQVVAWTLFALAVMAWLLTMYLAAAGFI